jgi:hypothetical protein
MEACNWEKSPRGWPVDGPPERLPVQGLRHRIAGLDALVDELVRRKAEVPDDEVDEVVQELRAVLEDLEAAFGD